MQRANIYLDEDQLRLLKHLASEEGKSVSDLIRQAIERLLVERTASEAEWQRRFDELRSRVRGRLEIASPAEIEEDIAAAEREVKADRQARPRYR